MFRHALYIEEIQHFLGIRATKEDIHEALNGLVRDEQVFHAHNMYSLENSGQIFIKRLVGADVAAEKMKEARQCASIIASFPFVKSVCISGSLSKGYADEKSDIDFFIVTARKRLWISRSLLHVFKKLTYLVNKQHSFCMNYFIDESELCLEEQNIFTATELSTLIPLYNTAIYSQLIEKNSLWVSHIFPAADKTENNIAEVKTLTRLKKAVEWLFNLVLPEKVNNFLMWLTDTLWRYKWQRKNYPMNDYDLAMKTKWYVSKQHPLNYQKKVLEFNNRALQFK